MEVMLIVKANKDCEAGVMPSRELVAEMGRFNEELAKAGVLIKAAGLRPTSQGVRVKFSGSERFVIDGPFPETKELVGGFWLWKVQSTEEAIEWLKRAPFDGGAEVEIRPLHEPEDFDYAFTPELRQRQERLRAKVGAGK